MWPVGSDATAAVDAEAGGPTPSSDLDRRVVLLLDEAYRHGKAIGGSGAGAATIGLVGLQGCPGVVVGASAESVLASLVDLLAEHRVWARFAPA